MAITISGNRFTNAIVGRPQVGGDIDIYEINSTPKFAVGFGFDRADGNKFRYGQFAVATTAGHVMSTKFSDVMRSLDSNVVIAPASAIVVSGDNILPGNAGSRYFEITLASISANQLQGNYVIINGQTGITGGYTYRVKGNTATGNPASGNIRVQLYEPLQASLTTTTDVIFVGSPYSNLVLSTSGTDCLVAGVSMASMTAGNYGWVCERGVVGALQTGAITAGDNLVLSATAGSVATMAAINTASPSTIVNTPVIARAITNGGSGLIGAINIDLG